MRKEESLPEKPKGRRRVAWEEGSQNCIKIALCPTSGLEVAETGAARAYYGLMDYANLVVVHECGSEIEADLAKGALQAAGIDAMIQADYGRTPTRPPRMVGRRLQAFCSRRGRRRRPRSAGRAAGGAPRTGTACSGPEAVREAVSRALDLRASRFTRT